nr:trna (adenine(58)-n(1))-methyltransferase catalytic subunit trm61 [Quercus suber]
MLEKGPIVNGGVTHGFMHSPPAPIPGGLAMLHLQRDSLVPVILGKGGENSGYAEGAVTNTRFGSFPHSTLVGALWGSQIRASKVDTGTRGRKGKEKKDDAMALSGRKVDEAPERESSKRKSGDIEGVEGDAAAHPMKKAKQALVTEKDEQGLTPKTAIEAGSGFIHLLQPTPEAWTSSLDHRTQVVYTPDYSYILQRLRVRPGSTLIEAGAGSGSFTHAAVRAVFSDPAHVPSSTADAWRRGRVCSYEYHEHRVATLRNELADHGLGDTVILTHRDVCNDGFVLADSTLPRADAIFLDLPAPWQALQHLRRDRANSPLNPTASVHICTFSPCIEQVIATVSAMRKEGWTDIEMVEVQNKRIDVRREQVGLKNEGLRGVNASAATVDEAIARLREVETKQHDFHSNQTSRPVNGTSSATDNAQAERAAKKKVQTKAERLLVLKKEAEERKLYREGNLVHRGEPEVKTHTSYLVFAVLPKDWTESDEKACSESWD